jgi:hypothetical protein
LRIEAALPVARNGKLERSGVGQNRLLAVAVARIAALISRARSSAPCSPSKSPHAKAAIK